MLGTQTTPSTRAVIHTPDQRVRVFISSTLGELAEERAVVRDAIRRLRLSPVMFELGARPHPPRALYRAYLDQSHVFVGMYWQSYGWTAPGEAISGIEDEYDAAGERPKLIYVKSAAGPRDPRLEALLQRIERDDRASYKPFSSGEELRTLVEEDLALLLSERFAARELAAEWSSPARAPLPSFPTTFVGRETAIAAIRALFSERRARMVTLSGAGGIGKTRLALEVARSLAPEFEDGVLAVFLAGIANPDDVVQAIAAELRLESTGTSRLEAVVAFLRARSLLLVLDNFEHVMPAAPVVSEILRACPGVRALVTSRELLKLGGEHGYEVEPLDLPPLAVSERSAFRSEAVQLFYDRVAAVAPALSPSSANVGAVAEICRGLDGLPLAIELAAARARVLPVEEIRARLHDRFGLLVHGPRDAPERQRTLRATIAWSHELLSRRERRLFAHLAVFRGGFGMRAAEAVCACDGDVLDALSSLVDKSLIRSIAPASASLRFAMLETIREFGLSQLREAHEEDEVRARHAEFFLRWVTEFADAYREDARQQGQWVVRVAEDLDNLRAAMRWFLDHGRPGAVAAMGMALWDFWWIRSHLREGAAWMEEALSSGELSERERATAAFVHGVAVFGQGDYAAAFGSLSTSYETFRRNGDEDSASLVAVPYSVGVAVAGDAAGAEAMVDEALARFRERGRHWQVGYALLGKGRVAMLQGRGPEALAAQEEGAATLRQTGELMIRSLTLLNLAWGSLLAGRVDRAAEVIAEALEVLASLQNREGLARALEVIAAIAGRRGDPRRGALLLGAAEGVRREIAASSLPLDRAMLHELESGLRRSLGDARFGERFAEGAALSIPGAVALASAVVSGSAVRGARCAGATSAGGDPGLAYCGLDCGQCPIYVATVTGDDALRRKAAREWSTVYGDYLSERLGRREFKIEEMSCGGCRSANLFVGCSVCKIRACAIARGLDSCARCDEYATCRPLNRFHAVHPDARAALEAIRVEPQERA
jgi:predicted ATPase